MRKCMKCDYTIEGSFGCKNLAWCAESLDWCARGPRIKSQGNHPFFLPVFRWNRCLPFLFQRCAVFLLLLLIRASVFLNNICLGRLSLVQCRLLYLFDLLWFDTWLKIQEIRLVKMFRIHCTEPIRSALQTVRI